MDDPVAAFDLPRMLFGNEPPLFLAEIAVRTIIIYGYTLVLIRWIGSRSIAQLSLVEFLLVIALGSAVGDAMFYPDVPLVHCMVVITVVILLDKALSYILARNPRLEDVIEGKSIEIIRDGIINCEALEISNFAHDELFEQLRLKDVEHLGQVRAAYLETNGSLSAFKFAPHEHRPGLSIDPPWDVREPRKVKAGTVAPTGEMFACERCANVSATVRDNVLPGCPVCGGTTWHLAHPTKSPAIGDRSDRNAS
ncbi:DUF421 domain-containing protein [Mesorhizobium sp. CN2-181]|uniref:DUF421 domain-containing protein n=1 Tax=Mesorhizobium yinganensis TaxID=3157707 RepID=UPI0032B7A83C